jgi:ankyrin repeat protein
MFSVISGDPRVTELLLDAGARANASNVWGGTALMLAANNGEEAIVRQLLAAGADPRALDRNGDDAARLAERHGHSALANLLRAYRGHFEANVVSVRREGDGPPQ